MGGWWGDSRPYSTPISKLVQDTLFLHQQINLAKLCLGLLLRGNFYLGKSRQFRFAGMSSKSREKSPILIQQMNEECRSGRQSWNSPPLRIYLVKRQIPQLPLDNRMKDRDGSKGVSLAASERHTMFIPMFRKVEYFLHIIQS